MTIKTANIKETRVSRDDQHLKDYAAIKIDYGIPIPPPPPGLEDTDPLRETGQPTRKPDLSGVKRLHREAIKKDLVPDEELQKEEEEKQKKIQEEADRKRVENMTRIQKTAHDIQQSTAPVIQTGASVADRIGTLSTVGGVAGLLVILFILLFTVVQVNRQGDTRLKQIWYMLNGRATLQGSVKPEAPVSPPSTSASPPSTTGGNSATAPGTGSDIGQEIGTIIGSTLTYSSSAYRNSVL